MSADEVADVADVMVRREHAKSELMLLMRQLFEPMHDELYVRDEQRK